MVSLPCPIDADQGFKRQFYFNIVFFGGKRLLSLPKPSFAFSSEEAFVSHLSYLFISGRAAVLTGPTLAEESHGLHCNHLVEILGMEQQETGSMLP